MGKLPSHASNELKELRQLDQKSKSLANELNKEEMELIEEMKLVIKNSTPYDDIEVTNRLSVLGKRREELITLTELQVKRQSDSKLKRKKDSTTNLMEIKVQNEENFIDPNEPIYCTCKRISFGNMIACENRNCPIEWFHFECVGLPNDFDTDSDSRIIESMMLYKLKSMNLSTRYIVLEELVVYTHRKCFKLRESRSDSLLYHSNSRHDPNSYSPPKSSFTSRPQMKDCVTRTAFILRQTFKAGTTTPITSTTSSTISKLQQTN
eukprot:gene8248-16965_t